MDPEIWSICNIFSVAPNSNTSSFVGWLLLDSCSVLTSKEPVVRNKFIFEKKSVFESFTCFRSLNCLGGDLLLSV